MAREHGDEATGEDESFLDLDEEALRTGAGERATPGWVAFWNAWIQLGETTGLTSVALTKILHRKVPELIPILDSLVTGFYGVSNHSKNRGVHTMVAMHRDLMENRVLVDGWASQVSLEDGRPMTVLRAADIVIWTHQSTGCPAR